MSEIPVYFKQPIRWMRYYAHNRPNLFYSVAIGVIGPVFALTATPLRKKFLFADHEPVPVSYPVPAKRVAGLTGFDDE